MFIYLSVKDEVTYYTQTQKQHTNAINPRGNFMCVSYCVYLYYTPHVDIAGIVRLAYNPPPSIYRIH